MEGGGRFQLFQEPKPGDLRKTSDLIFFQWAQAILQQNPGNSNSPTNSHLSPTSHDFSGGSRPSDKARARSSRPWPRPWHKEGGGGGTRFKKNFLRPFGHQFGLKIRGAQAPLAPPLDLPLDLTPLFSHFYLDLFSVTYFLTKWDKNPNAICKQLRTSRGSSQKSSRELAEIPGQ